MDIDHNNSEDFDIELASDSMAEMVRSLIRGSSSVQNWPSAQRALRHLHHALEPMSRLSNEKWFKVMVRTTDRLSVDSTGHHDREWREVADLGARCYVELSSTDGFAAARARKAKDKLSAAAREAVQPVPAIKPPRGSRRAP